MKEPAFPHPRGYVCYHTKNKLSLNGKLDDPDWKAAPVRSGLRPVDGARSRLDDRLRLGRSHHGRFSAGRSAKRPRQTSSHVIDRIQPHYQRMQLRHEPLLETAERKAPARLLELLVQRQRPLR